MKRVFSVTILLMCFSLRVYAQKLDWSSTTDWRIYNCFQFSTFHYPVDSLKKYKHLQLNDDTVRNMLKGAYTDTVNNASPLWMGLFTVTYQLEGVERKILVSVYGDFFWDAISDKYYQIKADKRKEWLDYFTGLNLSSFNE